MTGQAGCVTAAAVAPAECDAGHGLPASKPFDSSAKPVLASVLPGFGL